MWKIHEHTSVILYAEHLSFFNFSLSPAVQFALEARLMVESGEDEESAYFVFIHSAVQDVLAMAFLLTLNTETIKRVLTNMWDGGNLGSALFFLFGLRYGRSSSIARLLKLVEGKDVVQESLPDLKIMIIDFIQNVSFIVFYMNPNHSYFIS